MGKMPFVGAGGETEKYCTNYFNFCFAFHSARNEMGKGNTRGHRHVTKLTGQNNISAGNTNFSTGLCDLCQGT